MPTGNPEGPVFILTFILLIPFVSSYAVTAEETLKNILNLPPAQRKAALEEGARKEGLLYFYTSVSATDHPKIMAAFEKDYPFIKTKKYRSTPSGVFTKLATEARAHHYGVDVVGTGAEEMWLLKKGGLSMPYLSPEREAFPAGAYDPQGYWASFAVTPLVLAFTPPMVSPGDIPKNYKDLLDPKWKGKMNLGTDEYGWFAVMLNIMGKEKGLNYMKALEKQDLEFPGSSSRMRVQLMMAGQSAITIAARARRVTEFKEKGAPVDFRMLDPYPGVPNSVALMRHAPSPSRSGLVLRLDPIGKGPVLLGEKGPAYGPSEGHQANSTESRTLSEGFFLRKSGLYWTPFEGDYGPVQSNLQHLQS